MHIAVFFNPHCYTDLPFLCIHHVVSGPSYGPCSFVILVLFRFQSHSKNNSNAHFTAIFRDSLGKPVPECPHFTGAITKGELPSGTADEGAQNSLTKNISTTMKVSLMTFSE